MAPVEKIWKGSYLWTTEIYIWNLSRQNMLHGPPSYVSSLNNNMSTCIHVTCILLLTHNILPSEQLNSYRRSILALAVFFLNPFPCPTKVPGQQRARPVSSSGTDFASRVGHFPFWLFSLLPSACSLSTLLLCLHPALHGLQQFDVMARCCGWPGGPSALLVSWLLSAWAPFKEIKHFCQLSHVLTQLCEMRSPHYPFSGRRRSVCVVYFRPIL